VSLHEDRLFPSAPTERAIARRLYAEVRDLPIISPHGHTDPAWFADDAAFTDPASLLIVPDHYVFRMLYSQGVALEDLGASLSDVIMTRIYVHDVHDIDRVAVIHGEVFRDIRPASTLVEDIAWDGGPTRSIKWPNGTPGSRYTTT